MDEQNQNHRTQLEMLLMGILIGIFITVSLFLLQFKTGSPWGDKIVHRVESVEQEMKRINNRLLLEQ